MYAIEFLGYGQFTESDYEYDTGESFQHQGGRHAVGSGYKKEAKKYTSRKRAISAAEKLEINFENCWKARVVEIGVD